MVKPPVRAVSIGDWPQCLALLSAAGLPTDDLAEFPTDGFLVTTDTSGHVSGLIGREYFGEVALLRSLVVSAESRGQGKAVLLLDALTEMVRQEGVTQLWLLTIDADAWFTRHGFRVADRQEAPEPIAHTREFAELCPGDAVLMLKELRN